MLISTSLRLLFNKLSSKVSGLFHNKSEEPRKKRKVDLIAYETEREVTATFNEIIIFIIQLSVTTILAMSCQSLYGYFFNDSFRRFFIKERVQKQFTWQINSITNVREWWQYMQYDVMDPFSKLLVFPNDTKFVGDDPLGLHLKPRFWELNIVLHYPRLYQIRVNPRPCSSHKFLRKGELCFDKYKKSVQSSEPYHKGTEYMDLTKSDIMPPWAVVERYTGGGYVKMLPYHETGKILRQMQEDFWVDRGTRIVVLTIESYNYNMELFTQIELAAEVLPTGSLVCVFYTMTMPLNSIWSTQNVIILIIAIVFYSMTVYSTGNEIFEWYICGFNEYWMSLWNYIDWGVIIPAYISLVSSIVRPTLVNRFLDDIKDNNDLASLDMINFNDNIFLGTIALCTFLLWIRIFRYIAFNRTMLHFNVALRRCAPEIFGFAIIFFITLAIFGIIGLLSFGTKHADFSNFTTAYFFMFRLMLHDFNYNNFQEIDPFWGHLYFMSYVLVIVFILVNMFLAIISQTYIDVKHVEEEEQKQSALATVLENFGNKIYGAFQVIQNRIFNTPILSTAKARRHKAMSVQFATTAKIETESETESDELKTEEYLETEESAKAVEGEEDKPLNRTTELLTKLKERIDLLEHITDDIKHDMETILEKLEHVPH